MPPDIVVASVAGSVYSTVIRASNTSGEAQPSRQTLRAPDATAFFMADVLTGVGPFLAIYLAASLHWSPPDIGVAMSVGGIAAIIAQTPAGALVDRLRHKREAIATGCILVALGCLASVWFHTFWPIISSQMVLGVVGTFFPPAMAGMTLGIVGASGLDRRIGRNETFNHAGNVFNAAAAGLLGYYISQRWIFYYAAFICLVTTVAVFFIRDADIDFNRSRSLSGGSQPVEDTGKSALAAFAEVLSNRTLLVFVISVVLFHFANAAMLPLVGEELSRGNAKASSLYMGICIVGAQFVMIPVAALAGNSPLSVAGNRYSCVGSPRFHCVAFSIL